MIAVPQVGEEEDGHVNHVPKSLLVGIIAPRLEETFELVRGRLEASGCDKVAGRRVVLTGGACQLHGVRELAGHILDKQVRIGRPIAYRRPGRSDARPRLYDCRRALRLRHVGARRIAAPRRRPAGYSAASAMVARKFVICLDFAAASGTCVRERHSECAEQGSRPSGPVGH